VTGSNCSLFVAKGTEFSGQWKLQHQQLRILDNKCGGWNVFLDKLILEVPIPSPDGKFVAFVEDNSQTIIIHKVDFFVQLNPQYQVNLYCTWSYSRR
jgi:hypothetical protein